MKLGLALQLTGENHHYLENMPISFDIHDCAGNLKGHAPKLLLKSGSVSRQVTRAIEKTLFNLGDIWHPC
jgi:hypothetical protein